MPKIQFTDLPLEIQRHLVRRIRRRKISASQVDAILQWVLTEPEAPAGDWYKRFDDFILCGTGAYPKTVLEPGMKPFGIEL